VIPRALERFVQEQMIATHIPGLSMALLHGGTVVERHFGMRELRHRIPPGSDTRYGIGSVTKVFTALAVMQLVAVGRLRLEDPLTLHLPREAASFGTATIRQVLAHAAGIPALGWSETKMSSDWPMDGFPIGHYDDLATFMDGAHEWRTDPPGARWRYSNEGYLLLGLLIERLTGSSYADVIASRILTPLGMRRSTFDPAVVEADPDRVDQLMRDERGFLPGSLLRGAMPAAGGLVSTTADMTALARALLAAGALPGGGRLLPAPLIAQLAQSDVALDTPTALSDAAIWGDPLRVNGPGLQCHQGVMGRDVWAHGGGVMGGTAYLAVAPARTPDESGSAVVLLANAHGYPLAQLALVALVTLWGGAPEDLAFVRRARLLERLGGRYAAYGGTIVADLTPRAWGLDLTFAMQPKARGIPLVLQDHDDAAGVSRFIALGSGRPALAEVITTPAGIELRYERYALRRRS
jgi:CubicO group peptidase (beta-lactamase class C family)